MKYEFERAGLNKTEHQLYANTHQDGWAFTNLINVRVRFDNQNGLWTVYADELIYRWQKNGWFKSATWVQGGSRPFSLITKELSIFGATPDNIAR